MKTAISVPDATYERASHKAKALGMSRSEFFSRAATRYLDELDAESVTAQIDYALTTLDGDEESVRAATSVGRRLLAGQDDDW